MMNLFDTHAHILDEKFDEDRQQVIQRIYDNMALVVNIGCNLDDCPRTVALAEQYDKLYAAVGLHPEDVTTYTPEGWDMICQLAQHPKVVGIGETGLDYYWDVSTKEAQKRLFRQHIDLACQLHKPLVIHDREAHGYSKNQQRPSGRRHSARLLRQCRNGAGSYQTGLLHRLGRPCHL